MHLNTIEKKTFTQTFSKELPETLAAKHRMAIAPQCKNMLQSCSGMTD